MAKFRKIPVVIEADQWFKNGDHPDDNAFRDGQEWEGQVVRYFRRPDCGGESICPTCGERYHDHGFIDTLEGGHTVCPGDYIITGVKGERYPCKPDIFQATYEYADGAYNQAVTAIAHHLEVEEGRRPKAYKCTKGKTTVGIGRNLDDKGLSTEEIDFLVANDIKEVLQDLAVIFGAEAMGTWPEKLTVAMASMRFQLGYASFRGFRNMIAAVRRMDLPTAADEALDSVWARKDTPNRARRVATMIRTAFKEA